MRIRCPQQSGMLIALTLRISIGLMVPLAIFGKDVSFRAYWIPITFEMPCGTSNSIRFVQGSFNMQKITSGPVRPLIVEYDSIR